MGRIIITNATILALDEKDTFLYPSYLEIRDDKIYSLGDTAPDFSHDGYTGATESIDGTDKLLMPGLVDLHFHTSIAKGYEDDLPLWEYLDEIWYPAIRALTPETARLAALHSYATALKSGTTTVNDMYRQLSSLASAAEQIGIRAVLSNDIALPEHRLDSVADNIAAFRAHHGSADGRVTVWMGLEWLPLADEALLKELAKTKRELGTGLHIHLCESRSELADCATRYGDRTPIQVAYDAGLLGPDTVAAHCVHLSDSDIELLAKTSTNVSINSGSNAKVGNGIARLGALVDRGVNCGMGVDACECHNSTDMFEEMKITSYMQRALHENAALGRSSQMLQMATVNGARALGVEAGVLAAGKKADIIIIDLKKDMMFTPLLKAPTESRRKQLESHLVFGCNGTAVQTVIVNGQVVVRDRVVLGIDEEDIRSQMDQVFADLVDDMESKRIQRPKH
ncbi:Uu.00g083320.m01.CDS01 [Anthostomella pinea]|uniref:Uu.00g083320.m01.CDS01 n=1 Tax=Anthostomella pinea TaxID=933095 RepID=A0AAI8VLI3_9PEZI|nr:Uu.00g083320.m01.CDS01 [Anthostomella pinea]